MSPSPVNQLYNFAGFSLDPTRRVLLSSDGKVMPLPARAFDILQFFLEHPGELLDKRRLMDAVWPHTVVEENNLNQHIMTLRRALGEQAGEHRFIATVAGRGFHFIPPVVRLDASSAELRADAAGSFTPVSPAESAAPSFRRLFANTRVRLGIAAGVVVLGILLAVYFWKHISARPRQAQSGTSLAVLPFIDMSPQHDQQYFSDGLAEELLNRLAQLPDLRVIGRTSSFAFRGRNDDLRKIGDTLNVNHVLEGSVRKYDNRVRVTVQLIDTSDGSSVWSQTYERTLDDVFAIQEDIGRAVATELELKFDTRSTAPGGTRNFAAFDEFLTGRALLNSNELSTTVPAVSYLERAVARDPHYLDAWIWLIDSYARKVAVDVEHRADLKAAQQRAIERVSALAPGSVYAAIASSYGALSAGPLQDAGKLLESTLNAPQGIRARVQMRYGQFLLSVGHSAAAVDQLIQTRAADPLDVFLREQLILAFEVDGQLDRADAEDAQLLKLPGGDSALLQGDRIVRAMGRMDRDAIKAALARTNDGPFSRNDLQAQALANLDDPRAALDQLRLQLNDPRTRSDVFALTSTMEWAAFLGDSELALRAAHQSAKLGVSFEIWAWTLWRPVMKDVRQQPAFKTLLQEMGLVDYWRATGKWGEFCKPAGNDDFACT